MSKTKAERQQLAWETVMRFKPLIRYLSKRAYAGYPKPEVQDAADISQGVMISLFEYLASKRRRLENAQVTSKIRHLIVDQRRKNNRLGFRHRGDPLPHVCGVEILRDCFDWVYLDAQELAAERVPQTAEEGLAAQPEARERSAGNVSEWRGHTASMLAGEPRLVDHAPSPLREVEVSTLRDRILAGVSAGQQKATMLILDGLDSADVALECGVSKSHVDRLRALLRDVTVRVLETALE